MKPKLALHFPIQLTFWSFSSTKKYRRKKLEVKDKTYFKNISNFRKFKLSLYSHLKLSKS